VTPGSSHRGSGSGYQCPPGSHHRDGSRRERGKVDRGRGGRRVRFGLGRVDISVPGSSSLLTVRASVPAVPQAGGVDRTTVRWSTRSNGSGPQCPQTPVRGGDVGVRQLQRRLCVGTQRGAERTEVLGLHRPQRRGHQSPQTRAPAGQKWVCVRSETGRATAPALPRTGGVQ
jgi:hypothetical protein